MWIRKNTLFVAVVLGRATEHFSNLVISKWANLAVASGQLTETKEFNLLAVPHAKTDTDFAGGRVGTLGICILLVHYLQFSRNQHRVFITQET